jgi:hypothetical protein
VKDAVTVGYPSAKSEQESDSRAGRGHPKITLVQRPTPS